MGAFKMEINADEVRREIERLQSEFKKLPQFLVKKHIKAAMKRAIKSLKLEPDFKRAAMAHKHTGNLAKSVGVLSGIGRGAAAGIAWARVGYQRKRGRISKKTGELTGRKPGYHALLLHYGTRHRFQETTNRCTGEGPETRFASAVLAKSQTAVPTTLVAELQNALAAAVRELPKYLKFKKR